MRPPNPTPTRTGGRQRLAVSQDGVSGAPGKRASGKKRVSNLGLGNADLEAAADGFCKLPDAAFGADHLRSYIAPAPQ